MESRPLSSTAGSTIIALSTVCEALNAVCIKLLGPDVSREEFVFMRSVFAVLLLLVWLRGRKEPVYIFERRDFMLLTLRGLFATLAIILFVEALDRAPLAVVIILMQTHAMFSLLLARWSRRRSPAGGDVMRVLLSFSGVLLVVTPEWSGTIGWSGMLAALGSSASLAASFLCLNQTAARPGTAAISFPLVSIAVLAPIIVANPNVELFAIPRADVALIACSAMVTSAAQVLLALGFSLSPLTRGAIVMNLQVVFAMAFGWLIFNEPISWTSIAGAAFIVHAGVLSEFRQFLSRRRAAPS